MTPRLADIFDQEPAIGWIRQAWRAGRLPHGLVFAGPDGVGKGASARALSALFLCHDPVESDACGKCESCRLMSAGTHPDFAVVHRFLIRLTKEDVKAKDLVVDVIRDYLIEPANLTPALNHGRAFVVEEADLMNTAAQNSLLKTLEEPRGRTLIILLTDQPQALLQTIRSRTQMLAFGRLSRARVLEQLALRGVDQAPARASADLAEGSLGLALRWIDDGVAARSGELMKQLDGWYAGGTLDDLAGWLRAAADAYVEKQVERDPNASEDQARREGVSLYLKLAAERLARRMRDDAGGGGIARACDAIEVLSRADQFLDANVNIAAILQQVALSLNGLGLD